LLAIRSTPRLRISPEGDHIELGDIDHMLAEPDYVPDSLNMPAALQRAMVSDHNFLTAYEDLLRVHPAVA
jgi:hypothetical protein